MVSADENAPIGGSARNGKAEHPAKQPGKPPAKKTAKRSRKRLRQEPKPDQTEQTQIEQTQKEPTQIEQTEVPIATIEAMETPTADGASEAPAPSAPVERAESAAVSLQMITDAYGDYTRKSIEQTSSFFEQLAGTRSLTRALELQSEFARQAYETFVAETRKIRELHGELARQRLQNLEDLVVRMRPTRST
ncbi:MAG: phasin family protein [Bradyrhizobium sp.]|nr:phasin family protein [Bradyrhizobium sp.]